MVNIADKYLIVREDDYNVVVKKKCVVEKKNGPAQEEWMTWGYCTKVKDAVEFIQRDYLNDSITNDKNLGLGELLDELKNLKITVEVIDKGDLKNGENRKIY